jgi:hypothetical protein
MTLIQGVGVEEEKFLSRGTRQHCDEGWRMETLTRKRLQTNRYVKDICSPYDEYYIQEMHIFWNKKQVYVSCMDVNWTNKHTQRYGETSSQVWCQKPD